MMESKLIRTLLPLGIPGVALGFSYLLLRTFRFEFSQVSAELTAAIAALFLIVVGGITVFALHKWAPSPNHLKTEIGESNTLLSHNGENVTFSELLRSATIDIVKINAHSHILGVKAEYKWLELRYSDAQKKLQQLVKMRVSEDVNAKEQFFDVLTIELPSGHKKDIYFDISGFFDGEVSSTLDPKGWTTKKIKEVYKNLK